MQLHPFDELKARARHTRHNFVRDIRSEVTSLDNNQILIVTRLLDEYHDLSVAMVLDAELCIAEIACKAERMPYPTCEESEGAYDSLIGLNVYQRGILREIRSRVEREAGCTHFTELIEASLRALFAGLYNVRRSVDIENLITIEQRRQLNIRRPMLAGTCRSFRKSDRNDGEFEVAIERIREAGYDPAELDPHGSLFGKGVAGHG